MFTAFTMKHISAYLYTGHLKVTSHKMLKYIVNLHEHTLGDVSALLADRTGGRAIGTVLRLSVVCL